jgi:adhesin transport system outer membrane protein
MDATTSRKTEFNVGLYISGDLYQGGAATARRNAAGYALRASEAARDRARLDVQHSLREASVQTGSMGRLLGSLSARDKMMQETRDLYQKQYIELGTRTLLDLLNAEQELHQARFNRVNTLHDIRRLDADCLYSSGMLRSSFALNGISVRGVVLTP